MTTVLWLLGPSGVGKSTVGWAVYRLLERASYVDADQLGLCYPSTDDDPENHRIKSDALGAMWPELTGSPLVVSGFLNTPEDARRYTDRLPGADITLCRLRVRRAELRTRFLGRGWLTEEVDRVLDEAEELERATDFADFTVDTDGRTPASIAAEVRGRWIA
ncbi:AAA family ATPase [Actinosynnema sp. NPDC050801]|uniref:AAA family ATPase n=1 Tax=unclassified Actinosynnema TaxID=2637065 RepID=UPI0034026431